MNSHLNLIYTILCSGKNWTMFYISFISPSVCSVYFTSTIILYEKNTKAHILFSDCQKTYLLNALNEKTEHALLQFKFLYNFELYSII